MGPSAPAGCRDQQPPDIVGFSPTAASCAPSSIMFLFNINPGVWGWVGVQGGSQLVRPLCGSNNG